MEIWDKSYFRVNQYMQIQMRPCNNKAPLAAFASIFIIITFCLGNIHTQPNKRNAKLEHSSTWVRMWLARITNWTLKAFIILTNYTYRRKVFLLLTTDSFHLPPHFCYISEKCLSGYIQHLSINLAWKQGCFKVIYFKTPFDGKQCYCL